MGILGGLFGKKEELTELDASSPAAGRIQKFRGELEQFVQKMHDRIQLVPAEETVYIYVGKPPGMFGMAWFENGAEVNFKTLMTKDKGLSQRRVQHISLKLGEAFEHSKESPRYSVDISGKKLTVIPSDRLASEIKRIIQEGLTA